MYVCELIIKESSDVVELPALPYAKDAMAPPISRKLSSITTASGHQTYVTNLNNLIKATALKVNHWKDYSQL
ncbi:hypothetical protein ACNKHU_09960 [Shigella flexneri]